MSTTPPDSPKPGKRPDDARGTPPGAGIITPAHGGRIGNPPFVPTPEQRAQARTLAQAISDHSEKYIAAKMGISVRTLQRHFAEDLDAGRADMIANAGAQLISKALRGDDARDGEGKLIAPGNLDALKFLLARRAGWTTKVEVAGKNGRPIEHVDLSRLTPAQLEEYGRLAAIAEGLDPEEVIGNAGE